MQLCCPTCGHRFEDFRLHSDPDDFDIQQTMQSAILPVVRSHWYILCPLGHKWTVKTLWRSVNEPDSVLLGEYLGEALTIIIDGFENEYRWLSNFWIEPDKTHVEGEYQAEKHRGSPLAAERSILRSKAEEGEEARRRWQLNTLPADGVGQPQDPGHDEYWCSRRSRTTRRSRSH